MLPMDNVSNVYETLNYFAAMTFKPKPTKLFKFDEPEPGGAVDEPDS